MTSEKIRASSQNQPIDQESTVSGGRRRLLKGSALTAPVLLTLPSFSVAAASNALRLIEQPAGLKATDEGTKNPGDFDYLQVLRPVFRVKNVDSPNDEVEIINTALSANCRSIWVDLNTLGDVENGGLEFKPDSSACATAVTTLAPGEKLTVTKENKTLTYQVQSGDPRLHPLVVGVDSEGVPVSVGRTNEPVFLTTQSSWASAGPAGAVLPQ